MALVDEGMSERRADKTCDSCNKVASHLISPQLVYRGFEDVWYCMLSSLMKIRYETSWIGEWSMKG